MKKGVTTHTDTHTHFKKDRKLKGKEKDRGGRETKGLILRQPVRE